ncbi:MAG: Gfo/Idh/MocA family oxidoreductase, partial [Gemmataceae bacterium]
MTRPGRQMAAGFVSGPPLLLVSRAVQLAALTLPERVMAKLTKEAIGVGFIGAGDISVLHAAAVKKCPGATLVGLWNRNQERATQRAGEFGCRNYKTPEELVKDPAVDAVFVLTNLETHL